MLKLIGASYNQCDRGRSEVWCTAKVIYGEPLKWVSIPSNFSMHKFLRMNEHISEYK